MAKRKSKATKQSRRTFSKEFKQEAVQMLLDGHSASSVSKNLGIGNTNLLYRWKAELVADGGPVAESLDAEVRELRNELQRTQRERDILKKALAIFSRQE
ncbi:transposase [Mariniblastus sp.]|nr:transposase [Mariniblastus sp.]